MFPAAPLSLKARVDAEGNGDGAAAIGAAGPPPVCEVGRILSSQNCFDLLKIGVSKSPAESDVLAAYKALSRVIHPDKYVHAHHPPRLRTAPFSSTDAVTSVQPRPSKPSKVQRRFCWTPPSLRST